MNITQTNWCRNLTALTALAVAAMALCFTQSARATICTNRTHPVNISLVPSKTTVTPGEAITLNICVTNTAAVRVYFYFVVTTVNSDFSTEQNYHFPEYLDPGQVSCMAVPFTNKAVTGCTIINATVEGGGYDNGTPNPTPIAGCSGSTVQICVATKTTCPLSQGYWKTHCDVWPVTSLTMGCQTYTKSELIYILKAPSYGDASGILADQLIAALLNIANGAPHDAKVDAAIANANDLLCQAGRKVPACIRTSTTLGSKMVCAALILDAYNNGLFTPGCSSCNTEHDDDCDRDCGSWHGGKKCDNGRDRDRRCRH